jgi:toxin YoeB
VVYKLLFEPRVKQDLIRLEKENPALVEKVSDLIVNILENPFLGLGKPEPLKGNFSGSWSRRISQKHRLVYFVDDDNVTIIRAFGHYDDK